MSEGCVSDSMDLADVYNRENGPSGNIKPNLQKGSVAKSSRLNTHLLSNQNSVEKLLQPNLIGEGTKLPIRRVDGRGLAPVKGNGRTRYASQEL